MDCAAIHTWSFSTLVGAFLDLALSYLLLCCSALAYLAAKFLGFFGLCLPCPCNGLFGDPDGTKCLQQFLVEAPVQKISSVQLSVRSRFPFDSILTENNRHSTNVVKFNALGDARSSGAGDGGLLELRGGEESCSSLSEAQNSRSMSVSSSSLVSRDEAEGSAADADSCWGRRRRADGKGKGVSHQKPPSGLRRRRKAAAEHGKFSAVSSSSDAAPTPSRRGGEIGDRKGKESIVSCVNSGGNRLQYDAEEVPTGISLVEGALPIMESNTLFNVTNTTNKESSFVEDIIRSAQDGNEAHAIRILEQALEEEHAARTALYLELEKERSAAASAADEAMAMILRLQEEKSLIEMEARQYQRLIEEKSYYDEEEMNILKEILVRREREKYFLEKEVEAYRNGEKNQLLEDDLSDMVDMPGQRPFSSFDSSEDPMMMLQQLSESIRRKEIGKDVKRSPGNGPSTENQSTLADDDDFIKRGDIQMIGNTGKHYPHVQEGMKEENLDFQEKGIVSADNDQPAQQDDRSRLDNDSSSIKSLDGPQGGGLRDQISLWPDEENGPKDESGLSQLASAHKADHACRGVDFEMSHSEMEASIHDVHVVDDKHNLCKEVSGKESELLQAESSNKGGIRFESSEIRKIDPLGDHPSSSRADTGGNIHRSSSDMVAGFPPLDNSRGKVLFCDSRRTSLSEVDVERLKLETEVGRLTERLRIVQQGREKLTFSVGYRDREKFQLQLLEEIASQLREIRSLTQPGKAARQASLPPPSSKVNSKKRRCRSASWGVQESS